MKRIRSVALLFAALACSPQLHHRASPARANPADDVEVRIEDVPVRGYQVSVELRHGGSVEGELLAAEADRVVVMQAGSGIISELDIVEVSEVEVEVDSAMSTWSTLGSVSTLSHGFWLVFTLPLWLTGAASAAQYADEYADPKNAIMLDLLRQYARFPQGMPRAPLQ